MKSLQLPARPPSSLNITMSERGYYATDMVECLLILISINIPPESLLNGTNMPPVIKDSLRT